MKKMNFLITDVLNQQIEETMLRLGINGKAEFFRFLALNCAKENGIRSTACDSEQQNGDMINIDHVLTEKEKIILTELKQEPQLVDSLVDRTGFSISEVLVLLTQLLLKNRVVQKGMYWSTQNNFRT